MRSTELLTPGRSLARVSSVKSERRVFNWALGVSLLLHLVLLFLVVPGLREAWPNIMTPVVQLPPQQPPETSPPLQFEFVDLANEKEEPPQNPDEAVLSDMDRRAHGGEGQASNTPSSQGNTPQLVQAVGGEILDRGAPPQQPGPPTEPVPEPATDPSEQQPVEPQAEIEPLPEGAGESEQPTPIPQVPRIKLPPPGVFALPPDAGGLPENPDRSGGAVDTGGLSFDTQWFDWGPYAKLMLAKIRRHWRIPEIAQMGVSGRVRIRFYIERDGTVTGLQISDESGKPPMDFAARDAIADSSPFRPLPPELRGSVREGVTITFFYNSSPPDRGGN
jgi:TonB family protein